MHPPRRVVILLLAAAAAGLAQAGPLDPPAGPIGPTGKTLMQVEPRIPVNAQTAPPDQLGESALHTIVEPGSYYLVGDLASTTHDFVVLIDSRDVTLDLNGFRVEGGVLAAIAITGDHVTIRNGVVRESEGTGVTCSGMASVIEDIRVADVNLGIRAGGGQSVVRRCVVRDAPAGGISVEDGIVSDCQVDEGSAFGISAQRSIVTRCRVALIEAAPAFVLSESVLTNSLLSGTGARGVIALRGSVVRDCTLSGFGLAGIQLGDANDVDRPNAAINNYLQTGSVGDTPIVAFSADNRIEGNTIAITTDIATGIGIQTTGSGGGNIVINNSVTGAATAYDLDPADAAGPIIGPADVAATTSPVANIEH